MPAFKIKNYTFGSDFEMATLRDGNPVPPMEIEGSKWVPEPIENNCYLQRDGVAAEMNIPPVKTKKDWLKYTNYCFDKTSEIISVYGLTLQPLSSHVYLEEQLNQGDLRDLFCNYSLDAYNNGKKRKANDTKNNLRTMGYHIHVGFDEFCPETNNKFTLKEQCKLALHFDLHLGIPSVILDTDIQRRTMYGLPGDFRFKNINQNNKNLNLFEYRSLGGNLLRSKKLISWVYDASKKAIKSYNNDTKLPNLNTMKEIIINSNREKAQQIITEYKLTLV